MHLFRKLSAGIGVLALTMGMFNVPVYAETADNKDFDDFMTAEFVKEMESDYLTMHYALKNPAAYGVKKPEPVISSEPVDDYEGAIQDAQETLAKLEAFDYNALSDRQKHDYDVYRFALQNSIAMNQASDFDFAFLPTEGLINNLVTNFTEFSFREEEDFDDYLAVLASVPALLEDVLELTEKQAADGFFMTDAALDDTLEQIERFAEKKDDNQLIVIFEEGVDGFEGLSEARAEELKEANRALVLNEYIPAYEHAGEVLESLRGSRAAEGGLCELEGGEDYYRALVRVKSSSDRSIEDLIEMCTSYLNRTVDQYIAILRSNAKTEGTVKMSDPMEILDHLSRNLDYYPEIADVSYVAKYLDPSVANDGIVAYYLNPPIDDMEENQIKINGDAVSDHNELYTTLAHEGMPGHLYQTNYYLGTNPNPMRTQLSSIGYGEGWAMYAEVDSLNYAGLDASVAKCIQYETGINYVLDAVVDLGVNGLGWKRREVSDYLDALGLNASIAELLIDFVTENPGTILPYGTGLVQFMDIRDYAQQALGADFDLKEFNTVLLDNGDRPFELVKADVMTYVEARGGSEPVPAKMPMKFMAAMVAAGAVAVAALVLALYFRRKDPMKKNEA